MSDEPLDPTRALSYAGRHVVVTGASDGIGAATARALRVLGAFVTGVDRRSTSPTDRHMVVDLGDPESPEQVAAAVDHPVDGLFHCAGISGTNPRDLVMQVNFRSVRRLSNLLVDAMPWSSAIVSMASVAGASWTRHRGDIDAYLSIEDHLAASRWCDEHPRHFARGAYSFSKQCLIVWSKRHSVELAARGVRINTISPGAVDTALLRDAAAIGGHAAVDAMPKPLGRIARPDEPAMAAVFLNSRAAGYITGQDLAVDAGLLGGLAVGVLRSPLIEGPAIAAEP